MCWGVSFYLIAPMGPFIAAELEWSSAWIYGGFSAALVVMGLSSTRVGRLVDRHGGARAMAAGSIATALGCALLAAAHDLLLYYAAWLCLGLAMRLTLYDAAFAALARLGGAGAQRPMALVTLAGGLASTVFWPLGDALARALGWRTAVLIYGALGLATVFLHLDIPAGRHAPAGPARGPAAPPPIGGRRAAGALYATIMALATFLASGMSAHMIGILQGLGVAASAAVWIAALRGAGQSAARLAEVSFRGRLHPLALGVLATALLPVSFAAGFASGTSLAAGITFAVLYGAGNGLVTIVRGTVPLVLFEPEVYGAVVGRLLIPSFLLSAAAPIAYALVLSRWGAAGALALSLGGGVAVAVAALALRRAGRQGSPGHPRKR